MLLKDFFKELLQRFCKDFAQRLLSRGPSEDFVHTFLQRLSSTSFFLDSSNDLLKYFARRVCSNIASMIFRRFCSMISCKDFAQRLLQWVLHRFCSKMIFKDSFSKILLQDFFSKIVQGVCKLCKDFSKIVIKYFQRFCSAIFNDLFEWFFQLILFTLRRWQQLQWLSKPCLLAFCVYISYHVKPLLQFPCHASAKPAGGRSFRW